MNDIVNHLRHSGMRVGNALGQKPTMKNIDPTLRAQLDGCVGQFVENVIVPSAIERREELIKERKKANKEHREEKWDAIKRGILDTVVPPEGPSQDTYWVPPKMPKVAKEPSKEQIEQLAERAKIFALHYAAKRMEIGYEELPGLDIKLGMDGSILGDKHRSGKSTLDHLHFNDRDAFDIESMRDADFASEPLMLSARKFGVYYMNTMASTQASYGNKNDRPYISTEYARASSMIKDCAAELDKIIRPALERARHKQAQSREVDNGVRLR